MKKLLTLISFFILACLSVAVYASLPGYHLEYTQLDSVSGSCTSSSTNNKTFGSVYVPMDNMSVWRGGTLRRNLSFDDTGTPNNVVVMDGTWNFDRTPGLDGSAESGISSTDTGGDAIRIYNDFYIYTAGYMSAGDMYNYSI